MSRADTLATKRCLPCEGGIAPLTPAQITAYLASLDGWASDGASISKVFEFKNFYRTMAFVNALALIAHNENHHPDLAVGYNYCVVSFATHAISGLSENDFICAAKVDALLKL